jgi:hypothetical protein
MSDSPSRRLVITLPDWPAFHDVFRGCDADAARRVDRSGRLGEPAALARHEIEALARAVAYFPTMSVSVMETVDEKKSTENKATSPFPAAATATIIVK